MEVSDRNVTSTASNGIPWRSPVLLAILSATLLTPMDVPLVSPVLPPLQTAFGLSASQAGQLITAYALPGIVLGPFLGVLADRVSRKYVLAGSLVLFGVTGVMISVAPTFQVIIALRVLQGVAAGSILSAIAMTMIGDQYTGRQHDAVMGLASAMLSVGTAIYPALGGLLAANSWRTPFVLYALTIPVAGLVLLLPETSHRIPDTTLREYLQSARQTVPLREACGLYMVLLVAFSLLFGGLYTVLPFYLSETFGYTPFIIGLVTSTVLLVAAFVSTQNGRLMSHASRTTLLVGGFSSFAVGFLGLGLATGPLLVVLSLVVFGTGSGLVTPTLFGGLSMLAPDNARGGVMGVQTTTIGASQALGPAVFTYLSGVGTNQTALLVGAGCATVSAITLAMFMQ